MKQELKGFEKFSAIIARWIVINIAARIHAVAVLSLSLEIARGYQADFPDIELDYED